jgi:hypothetical protein
VVVPGSVDGGKEVMERQPVPLRQVWVRRMHSTTTKNKSDGSIERSVDETFINK